MARSQVYRGNPELKQTILFDNFSGGVNTRDIDDQVATNEFRILDNVELINQGRLQKRKGFGLKKSLSSRFQGTKFSTFEYIYYFNSDRDLDSEGEINIEVLFKSRFDGLNYVHINIKDDVLTENIIFPIYGQQLLGEYIKPNITGSKVMNYNGYKYILSNQILKDRFDIIKFGKNDEGEYIFNIRNKTNSFKPNTYDVGLNGEGFNIFSEEPHKYVDTTKSTIESIRNVILVDVEDESKIYDKIPSNGKIKLLVYYTGVNLKPEDLSFRFYDENDDDKLVDGINVTLDSVNKDLGYMTFIITTTGVSYKTFMLEIYKEVDVISDSVVDLIDIDIIGVDQLINLFKDGPKHMTEINPETKRVRVYKKEVGSMYSYKIEDYDIHDSIEETIFKNYFLISSDIDLKPKYSENSQRVYYSKNGNTYSRVGIFNAGILNKINAPIYIPYNLYSKDDEVLESHTFYRLYLLDSTKYYKTSDGLYFKWTTESSGQTSDFKEIQGIDAGLTEKKLSYTMVIEAFDGSKPETNEIIDIDFSDAKGLIYNERLVLYKGNTVFWSSIHSEIEDTSGNKQEFTYFPNNNYFILPLGSDDSIQTINYYRGSYMLFTKSAIYRIPNNFDPNTFEVVMVSDAIGCISPDSVRSINNNLQFLSSDGLYVLKQNYYLDGMENVEKIDKQASDLIPRGYNYESIIYNEQYWLLVKDNQGNYVKTIKQYYNTVTPRRLSPITQDFISGSVENLVKVANKLYSFKSEYATESYKTDIVTSYKNINVELIGNKYYVNDSDLYDIFNIPKSVTYKKLQPLNGSNYVDEIKNMPIWSSVTIGNKGDISYGNHTITRSVLNNDITIKVIHELYGEIMTLVDNGVLVTGTIKDSIKYNFNENNPQLENILNNDLDTLWVDNFETLGYYELTLPSIFLNNKIRFYTDRIEDVDGGVYLDLITSFKTDKYGYEVLPNRQYRVIYEYFKSDDKFEVYGFDEGYTDFGEVYETVIVSPHLSFGYPLHEKKFKNIFVNVSAATRYPIDFDVIVDKSAPTDMYIYKKKLNTYGEIEYEEIRNERYIINPTGDFLLDDDLDNLEFSGELDIDWLGSGNMQVHKIVPSKKGRYVQLRLNIKVEDDFALDSINFVYKLGKMRERR